MIGTLAPDGAAFDLTITASTPRPIRLSFKGVPSRSALRDRINREISPANYYNDVHGAPAWRRQVRHEEAEQAAGDAVPEHTGLLSLPCPSGTDPDGRPA